MWFVITTTRNVKFFLPGGKDTEIPNIKWTHRISDKGVEYHSSQPVIENAMQAISALYEAGVQGFRTKVEAREFGKTLPNGKWKYLQIS